MIFEGRDAAGQGGTIKRKWCTPTPRQSPWYVVESDVKKHARLNMMSHLLSTIDYHEVEQLTVALPDRPIPSDAYQRPSWSLSTYVDDHVATLTGNRG